VTDVFMLLGLATIGLLALTLAAAAGLKAWLGWLELRRVRIEQAEQGRPELAELKARVRRLEVIADGRG